MTQGECRLCEYEYDLAGSFVTALFRALFRADHHNLQRLNMAYPEEVTAVWRYKNEPDYWERLRKEYLQETNHEHNGG